MKNLQSRMTGRTIRVETGAEPRRMRATIRDSNDEAFLSFTQEIIEQHPKLVCAALDRKMDTLLTKSRSESNLPDRA
jgi:hypothetical protein